MRVSGDQGWIIAADFSLRAFGIVEEKQVVDGDHLGGAARRDEQRVSRVDDV